MLNLQKSLNQIEAEMGYGQQKKKDMPRHTNTRGM